MKWFDKVMAFELLFLFGLDCDEIEFHWQCNAFIESIELRLVNGVVVLKLLYVQCWDSKP